MKILVCNAGSTSLKIKLYEMPESEVIAQCKIERIGSSDDAVFHYFNYRDNKKDIRPQQCILTYREGIEQFLACLLSPEAGVLHDIHEIQRIGYKATVSKNNFGTHELTDEVLEGMQAWMPLASIHNSAYIEAIKTMKALLPDVLSIGVFETDFHRHIPLERRMYGVPYEWYETYGIQRLGYHSASHGYIADVLNEKGKKYKAISCHLGGSSSVCGIKDGISIDTSFGMSLQSGLIHSTRVGNMDCDLYRFLKSEGLSDGEIQEGFERKGGIFGISGVSGDLRYVEEAAWKGNTRAKLALDVFVSGIVHYIGAFFVDLEGLDYLVFTAGIGENSPVIREMVCKRLSALDLNIDIERNRNVKGKADITGEGSRVSVWVIPTDEELGIARRTYEYLEEK